MKKPPVKKEYNYRDEEYIYFLEFKTKKERDLFHKENPPLIIQKTDGWAIEKTYLPYTYNSLTVHYFITYTINQDPDQVWNFGSPHTPKEAREIIRDNQFQVDELILKKA